MMSPVLILPIALVYLLSLNLTTYKLMVPKTCYSNAGTGVKIAENLIAETK